MARLLEHVAREHSPWRFDVKSLPLREMERFLDTPVKFYSSGMHVRPGLRGGGPFGVGYFAAR